MQVTRTSLGPKSKRLRSQSNNASRKQASYSYVFVDACFQAARPTDISAAARLRDMQLRQLLVLIRKVRGLADT